jgi:hypothetical protein
MRAQHLIAAILAFFLLPPLTAWPEGPLELTKDDLRIEQSREGGFNLYIRAKPGLGSVLITESTEDPAKKESSYAFRNPAYHPVNGDEKRILNGKFLDAQKQGRYFLISSTITEVPDFGRAYHIFIPYVVEYGYPWSRNGDLYIGGNSWINLRTFEKPYADYAGPFRDNPFVIQVIQPTPETPTPRRAKEPEMILPATVEAFEELAEERTALADNEDKVIEKIQEIVTSMSEGPLDLVLCIDTTGSMKDTILQVQKELVPMLLRDGSKHVPLRVGVVLYRDYFEEYITRELPFQSDLNKVQGFVNSARAAGGGDIPEAVYEALYTALIKLDWQQEKRTIILIGDSPPHPRPRGRITKEMVFQEAETKGVTIHAILLPHP